VSASDHITGEAMAHADVARIESGTAEPELLLRSVLRIAAESGVMVPPTSMLCGYLSAIRKHIQRGRDGLRA